MYTHSHFSLRILDDLIQEVFPPTLKFLKGECCTALLTDTGWRAAGQNAAVSGVMEVNSFLSIFSSLLDRVLLREELEKKAKVEEGDGKLADIYWMWNLFLKTTGNAKAIKIWEHGRR